MKNKFYVKQQGASWTVETRIINLASEVVATCANKSDAIRLAEWKNKSALNKILE